jgi:hypothetical protein
VFLPSLAGDAKPLTAALSELLRETPAYLPGVAPIASADGRMDGRFATTTPDGVLWFEPAGACIK